MDIFTLGAIFALFRGIFSLPGLALMGLEDIAVEMAVCAQLKGACKALTEEQLQPLIRKVEESAVLSAELMGRTVLPCCRQN